MTYLLGVYKAQFRMTLARYLQYRVELHVWLAQIILRPIIFMVVWAAVAEASGGTLRGYTPRDFAAYFIVAMLVHHLTLAWMMIEWEPLVRTGELSYWLVRPCHTVHRYIGENFTFKSATLPFMLLAALVLAAMFRPAFNVVPWSLAVAVPALLLAAALFFVVTFMVGMLSFWTTEIEAINMAFFLLMFLFSGQMAPLSMSPPSIQLIGSFLPFRWIISFPTELILGTLTPRDAGLGILAQTCWLGLAWLGAFILWRRGIKMYTAVGL